MAIWVYDRIGDANFVHGKAYMTTDAAAAVIAAPGASSRIAILGILVTNKDAAVATNVQILSGSTVLLEQLAAIGGGFSLPGGGLPVAIGAANEAINAKCVTTGAEVNVYIWGVVVQA